MAKDGNINDSGSIQSGRKNENTDAYKSGYELAFGEDKFERARRLKREEEMKRKGNNDGK